MGTFSVPSQRANPIFLYFVSTEGYETNGK